MRYTAGGCGEVVLQIWKSVNHDRYIPRGWNKTWNQWPSAKKIMVYQRGHPKLTFHSVGGVWVKNRTKKWRRQSIVGSSRSNFTQCRRKKSYWCQYVLKSSCVSTVIHHLGCIKPVQKDFAVSIVVIGKFDFRDNEFLNFSQKLSNQLVAVTRL